MKLECIVLSQRVYGLTLKYDIFLQKILLEIQKPVVTNLNIESCFFIILTESSKMMTCAMLFCFVG